jgi:hypothetical protein
MRRNRAGQRATDQRAAAMRAGCTSERAGGPSRNACLSETTWPAVPGAASAPDAAAAKVLAQQQHADALSVERERQNDSADHHLQERR